jgi:hypothetical protein
MADRSLTRSGRGVDRALIAVEALAGVAVVAAIVGKAYGAAPTIFFALAGISLAFTVLVLVKMASAWSDETLDVVGRVRDVEREQLEHEKMLLLHGIKELEADAAVGKVDKRDYQYLRGTAESRAIEIIEKLKNDDARWMLEAERLVEKRLGRPSQKKNGSPPREIAKDVRLFFVRADGVEPADPLLFDDRDVEFGSKEGRITCTGCGSENEDSSLYCIGCGRPRAKAKREGATA